MCNCICSCILHVHKHIYVLCMHTGLHGCGCIHASKFIHSFIQEFIRRPFNKSTQRLPSLATTVQISLKQPAERTFIIFRQEADFQRESIPGGGTNNGECTTLLSCSFSTRCQYVCKYECKCLQI